MQSATVFFALVVIVASASSEGLGGLGWGQDTWAHPAYKYSYAVSDKHTGDQKTASEVRDGGVTKGSYSLVQPDGVVRTVIYQDVGHGLEAQVINKGVAGHPGGWGWGSQ